jgi:hypothetical protein
MSLVTNKRVVEETHGGASSPPVSPKRQKLQNVGDIEQIGATELASAMALASLASFSPKSRGHQTAPFETRDTEHVEDGSITSLKARSPPKEDPTPVTPETRVTTARERRVSFAPGLKDNERKEGSVRRLSFTPRFGPPMSRMPPGFARGSGAFGPPRLPRHHHQGMPPPWVRHSGMAPPGGGYMPPPPPRPMMMHHPHHHHHPHHPHYSPNMSHMYHVQAPAPPPAAAAAGSQNQWICDYCNAASFTSYKEACYHEAVCRRRPAPQSYQARQPPFLPGMTAPVATGEIQPSKQAMSGVPLAPRVQPEHIDDDRPPASDRDWFKGAMCLAVPDMDKEWLSEANHFIRSDCVEAFSASEEDAKKASKRGRITLDQVGIRCKFCKHVPIGTRTAAAVSYPASVAGIYESVKRWQRVHMTLCEDVPQDVKDRVQELDSAPAWVATTRQYWVDSARAMGMVDTLDGIRFGTDPSNPPDAGKLKALLSTKDKEKIKEGEKLGDGDAIVYPEDVSMVPPYVYFLMRQVESCHFTEADRFVARSKGPVGYPGFECRHCNGHTGLGKYFPVTSKSLATNSTSQNIHAHLLKCRKTPNDVKGQLMALKEEKTRSPRLEPGWRKVFFDQVWARLHGTEPE